MARSSPSWADASDRDYLQLCLVPGVGPRLRAALFSEFATATDVLDAPRSRLRAVPGVGNKLAARIHQARVDLNVADEIEQCRVAGIDILRPGAGAYPPLLEEIHDPPGVLFSRGNWTSEDGIAVAIVGTRHASHYGRRQAERLAGELVRAGFVVVSGLARGIDAAAHRGALAAGGRTLAVLGSGLLNVYPPEHADLAREISQRGVVLSELPPLRQPMSGTFPQRNRLISGLSLGVLVVEAAARSGALITARHAMEQGRDVFAMPGRVDSRVSQGCHRLLRDGACLVESVEDILQELGPLAESLNYQGRTVRHPAELQLNDQERQVLDAIETEPTAIDSVVTRCSLAVQQVLATISVLEMRYLVERVSGQYVIRK